MEFWVPEFLVENIKLLVQYLSDMGYGVDGFCAVWCRGFPVWLKYVPGISFRTDNEPFKVNFPFSFALF